MSTGRAFRRDVYTAVQDELADVGLEQRQPGLFTFPVSSDVLGWVGLNEGGRRRDGALEINPVVGVRNQALEKLVAEFSDERLDEVSPPTLAGNVGYLSPEDRYTQFLFTAAEPVSQTASSLATAIKAYGLPFIHANTELQVLVKSMRTARFAVPQYVSYRIPVALLMLEDFAGASVFVEREVEAMGDRGDVAAAEYRQFAARLRRAVDRRSSGGS